MSEKDEQLKARLLPEHELYEAEQLCVGEISLVAVTRESARVRHRSSNGEWSFYFSRGELTSSGVSYSVSVESPSVVRFAWHRAAEAMLAVRNGHMEATERKRVMQRV